MLQACMKYQKWGRNSRDHCPALVPPKATKDPFGNLWIESECQEGLTDLLCLHSLVHCSERHVRIVWGPLTDYNINKIIQLLQC